MSQVTGIDLLDGEEVVHEGGSGLLTNQRLFSYMKLRSGADAENVIFLSNITEYKKVIGGQDSHARLGLKLIAVGVPLSVAGVLFSSWLREIGELAELIVFMAGALGIVIGAYLAMRSLVRVPPHTTVFFRVQGGEDIPVSFPGRENPEADEFILRYSRAKRGI